MVSFQTQKMNITFPLQQKSRTGNLDAILKDHHYKLVLMARFMDIKSINPKMKLKELANQLD